MLPEVHGNPSDAMLRRLLSRKGISDQQLKEMLITLEDRGSAYLPQLNAFCIRQFQMMHAAEDAASFLHHACRGLPERLSGRSVNEDEDLNSSTALTTDVFYARVIEDAVAYFGSRVLYPSRPAAELQTSSALSRTGCEKAALAAIRGNKEKFESIARDWGYRIGSQMYAAYLEGKVKPAGLRRLFLVHLDKPGLARKVCAAVIARVRAASRG
jgi:hypothetical protein